MKPAKHLRGWHRESLEAEAPMKALMLVLALLAGQATTPVPGSPGDLWAEGGHGDQGATRDFYNAPAYLRSRGAMGDWLDAEGKPQGDVPFAETELVNGAQGQSVAWDVTRLVQRWVDGSLPNKGFFLRTLSGGGTFKFRSREFADASQHPQLVVDGRTVAPEADPYLCQS